MEWTSPLENAVDGKGAEPEPEEREAVAPRRHWLDFRAAARLRLPGKSVRSDSGFGAGGSEARNPCDFRNSLGNVVFVLGHHFELVVFVLGPTQDC